MIGEPIGTTRARFEIDGDQDAANTLANVLERLAAQVRERPPDSAEFRNQRVADVVAPDEAALNVRYSNVAVEVQW